MGHGWAPTFVRGGYSTPTKRTATGLCVLPDNKLWLNSGNACRSPSAVTSRKARRGFQGRCGARVMPALHSEMHIRRARQRRVSKAAKALLE